MNRFKQIIVLIFQVIFSAGLLFIFYFLFSISDFQGGLDGIIGLFISQIVFGSIILGATIIICLIIGLPIRLNKKINRWWMDRQIYILTGLFIALFLLVISMINYWKIPSVKNIDNDEYAKQVSKFYMSFTITSWFATAFLALHTYPVAVVKNISAWLRSKQQ